MRADLRNLKKARAAKKHKKARKQKGVHKRALHLKGSGVRPGDRLILVVKGGR